MTDFHFGRSSNSPQANKDNLAMLRWAIDEARTWGAETCMMMGDWHDNRASIGIGTMLASIAGMDLLNGAFKDVWWLLGNHDLLYRDRRDAASIEFAKYLPNIHLVRQPVWIDDVMLIPWPVLDEIRQPVPRCRYGFGHMEIPGFKLNSRVEMQETAHTPSIKQFADCGDLFSGHFHMRQSMGNVCYIGSIMPFDYGDANDVDRGIMLLGWGQQPEFRAWPDQPTYAAMTLSEMLMDGAVLASNMKVTIDVPLSYEEAGEIRRGMVNSHGLRKVELINTAIEEQSFDDAKVEFRSVDQIVVEGLQSVESKMIVPDRLVALYLSL